MQEATIEKIGSESFYKIKGKRFARVTSLFDILEKHGLKKWKQRVGEKEANRIVNTAAAAVSVLRFLVL